MLPAKTILHPTDFSPPSECAFRLASSLARDYGARLIVLHVMGQPLIIQGGVMTAPPDPTPPEEERQAIREELLRIHPPDPAVTVERLLEEGDAATGILQVAQERSCDLIVMGSHGRTGLGRLLLGSVAEQVVRKAPCPVLIVKLPQHQEKPSKEAMPSTADRATVTVK
jgi:nucleotide-binding universal stress UspA family protein